MICTGWFAALLSGAVGCSGHNKSRDNSHDTYTSELIATRDDQVKRALVDEPISTDSVAPYHLRVVIRQPLYRVGDPVHSESDEFGTISGGVILDGNVAVVSDFKKRRLAVIPSTGQPVRLFGRRGEGPGEFVELTALAQLDDSTVGVIDNGQFLLTTIGISDGSPHLIGSSRLSSQPGAFCVIDGDLAALDYDPTTQRIFRLLSATGSAISAFGLPLMHGTNDLNEVINQGHMLCAHRFGTVVLAAMTGDLVAYSLQGRFLWRRTIRDFVGTEIKVLPGGVEFITAPPPANRETAVVAFVALNDSIAILQMRDITRRSMTGRDALAYGGLESRLINLRDGLEVGSQFDLPQLVAVRDSLALVTSDDPQPWVELVPFRIEGASGHP